MPGGFPYGLEICNGTDIGTNAASTTPTSCSTAWTQLVASSAADAFWLEVSIDNNVAAGNYATANLGVGSAGNEVVFASKLRADGSTMGRMTYCFPCSIPGGTRISAQCVDDTHVDVQIRLFDGSFTEIEGAAGVDAVGYSAGFGTVVTPSATAHTKGSYAQLVASTSVDYMGFMLALDGQNGGATNARDYLVDLAIGGSGSEVIIVPNHLSRWIAASGMNPNGSYGPFFIPIPAGTRIAARCQSGGASGGAIGVTVYGIYQ